MKTQQWMGILFAFLLIVSGCTNNRGVVECPAFTVRNTNGLEIAKVELSDTATVLYMKAFFTPNTWIKINSKSFLTDNQGKQYTILSTGGIVLGEKFYMPDSGETEFTMTFPLLASNAVFVDFSEGDSDGAWKIWGIQLTNRPLKAHSPGRSKNVAIDKNAVLPPVAFQTGKARLEGQVLDYRPGMPAEVSVRVVYPFESSPAEITIPIDEKGRFSGEIDAFSTHPISVYWQKCRAGCFIASGETTSLVLNPAEASRRDSRLAGDRPSLGEPVYYGGYLASVSKELANTQPVFSLQYYNDNASFLSFLQRIGTKTPETLKSFFLDEYQAKIATLDTLDASPACKQIMHCSADLFFASYIVNTVSWIDRAYIYNNQLDNDREAVLKYYAARKSDLPDDFYNALNDFSLLNDPQILYVPETAAYIYEWQMRDLQTVFNKALGTGQGVLFDLMTTAGLSKGISEFKPASEAQIEEVPAGYQEFIRNKNNELLQLIEANKNKTGFTEHAIEDVADKDVFPFILSKFRGKPVLFDVWATWCGPCRIANEELKPVKAELADTDIVYVFVAGENSPLETWENMIPDLPGEHFRLSKKQWDYIGKTFGIEGVPTYFFIDRKGNIKEKQTGYSGAQQMKEKLLRLLSE